MKKKTVKSIFLIFIFIFLNECNGYKPIFGSADINFKISSHTISGDKVLGKQLYSKINNLSKSSKNDPGIPSINISINITKSKSATSKDSTGKILEYKINLNTKIKIENVINNKIILNQDTKSSLSYKVQDQYSDTASAEKITIENLINNTYREILIILSKNLSLV